MDSDDSFDDKYDKKVVFFIKTRSNLSGTPRIKISNINKPDISGKNIEVGTLDETSKNTLNLTDLLNAFKDHISKIIKKDIYGIKIPIN